MDIKNFFIYFICRIKNRREKKFFFIFPTLFLIRFDIIFYLLKFFFFAFNQDTTATPSRNEAAAQGPLPSAGKFELLKIIMFLST